jgi:hypothetical protein
VIRGAVFAIVAAIAAVAVVVGGCSIDSRSDDLRCGNGQGQCPPGRECENGWCVIDPDEVDGGACPGVCSRCEGGTCIIECDDPGDCDGAITCPADMPCDVRCELAGSCSDGITCSNARCEVTCSGTGSCSGDISCTSACACVTTCSGTGACSNIDIECPGPAFCTEGGQCTDQPNQCDRC